MPDSDYSRIRHAETLFVQCLVTGLAWPAEKVRISIGAPGMSVGEAWVDSVRVDEVGFVNVLRRPGTPVTVRADAGGALCEEGRD